MIPQINTDLDIIEIEARPSLTYKLDTDVKRISKRIDGEDAMLQSIWKILNTERYANVIYSSQYGVELEKLIGQDYDYIKADLKRNIEEALFADDRVLSVDDFTITQSDSASLQASFTVSTTEGKKTIETEVVIL